jgi:hypothetical protein
MDGHNCSQHVWFGAASGATKTGLECAAIHMSRTRAQSRHSLFMQAHPGSVCFVIPPGSAAGVFSWLNAIGLTETNWREVGLHIGLPVCTFAQIAVTKKLAPVTGAEVISERSGFLLSSITDGFHGQEGEEEEDGKDANEQLDICEVVHRTLLCIGGSLHPGDNLARSASFQGV